MANILVGEAIAQIQELYSKGVPSDDSRLSSRYVYSVLLKARGTVLKQQANKGQKISDWSYQPLSCVELEIVKQPNAIQPLLRSKYRLPTPISSLSGMLIKSVTSLDENIQFDPLMIESAKYQKGDKYSSSKQGFYIRDQHLVLTNAKYIKSVDLYGLFDDPIEAFNFPSLCKDCTDCDCMDMFEYPFPVDRDTLNAIVKVAANELLILFSQMKEDTNNNAKDDNESGNQMIHQPQEAQP